MSYAKSNSKCKIQFVGTGGGGSMVATQKLSTGGVYIETNKVKLYLDPGPGAVYRARELKVPLEGLDAILVTHRHLDHTSDIVPMLESWRNFENSKIQGKKWLFVPGDYLAEYPIPNFVGKKVNRIITLKPLTTYNIGSLSISTSNRLIEKPLYQDNMPEVYGFWLKDDNIDIGFWSQSQYADGITKNFHPKTLIMDFWAITENALKDQIKIISQINPKKVILKHFTLDMYQFGLDKIREVMQQRIDIPIQIAKQGESIYE